MKTYWGSGGVTTRILNFGTTWRWVVSFTPRPLCPRYQSDRRLDGPHSWCGVSGEERKSRHCPCRELNPGRPARSLVIGWATPAVRCNAYEKKISIWCCYSLESTDGVLVVLTAMFWRHNSDKDQFWSTHVVPHSQIRTCWFKSKSGLRIMMTCNVAVGYEHRLEYSPPWKSWNLV
jgi:hypothetical protein